MSLLEPTFLIILGVFLALLCYFLVVGCERQRLRHEREETPPPQREAIGEDRCEKVDRLFDVALVLITVFSTIVLSYASVRNDFQNSMLDTAQRSMAEVNFSFRVLTIPLVGLILVWLFRGLSPSHWPMWHSLKMVLRQFCWGFFFLLFILNALFFEYMLFTKNPAELFQFQNALSFSLIGLNFIAMWNYTLCNPGFAFFRSRDRRLIWIFIGPVIAEVVSWILIVLWMYVMQLM